MSQPLIRRRHAAALAALALVPALGLAAPGESARVSVSSAGVQGATAAEGSAQSADGRYIAFVSASALTATSTGAKKQLYVRDRQLGTTVMASLNAAGQAANADVDGAEPFNVRFDISGDGRYVVFATAATNLGAGDTNANLDVFRKDLQTGALLLVTVNSLGVQANASVLGDPSISGDGRYVVFQTAEALDPANDAANLDVYRRDRIAGVTALVSAKTGLFAAGNGASKVASISADGQRVGFESVATDLAGTDGNAAVSDAYVRTASTKVTERISTKTGGAQEVNDGLQSVLSPSGGYATFTYSDVGNHPLVTGDTNLVDDIFTKELAGPSDAVGPTISLSSPVDGTVVNVTQVAVTGFANDPSGVASLTVNGAVLRPGAAGIFTSTLILGAPGSSTPVSIVARDGSGNTTTLTRNVARPAPPVVSPPVAVIGRASKIRASRSGKFVVVRFTLSGDANVGVRLLRRSVKAGRARLKPVGTAVIQALTAGEQTVRLKAPRLRRGNYRVRVTVRTATGAVTSIRVLVAKPIRRLPPVAP